MAYVVTVRRGPAVAKTRHASLAEALDAVEAAAGAARRSERRTTVDLRMRSYAPGDQVAARVEIRGDGAYGGVDVRGNGTQTAYTGRVRRRALEPRAGEGAVAALRRALEA